MTADERSGWRDQAMSERHREWGYDCPAVDIDFLMIEYDMGEPVALVEYKHEMAERVRVNSPSLVALRKLADRADLPAFVVRYSGDLDWYTVRALNKAAKATVPEPQGRDLEEKDYVAFLYYLRGRVLDLGNFQCRHNTLARECKVCNGTVKRLIGDMRD